MYITYQTREMTCSVRDFLAHMQYNYKHSYWYFRIFQGYKYIKTHLFHRCSRSTCFYEPIARNQQIHHGAKRETERRDPVPRENRNPVTGTQTDHILHRQDTTEQKR